MICGQRLIGSSYSTHRQCRLWLCLFFFFFQAEDGIRDYKVTGVQTCALPIYFHAAIRYKPNYASAHSNLGNALAVQHKVADAIPEYQEALRLNPKDAQAHNNLGNALVEQGRVRSEERRVGKECRSRWSPYH